jgi:hypothetical protein
LDGATRLDTVMVEDSDKQDESESVVGPSGAPITEADLPPTNTKRWVIRRKAAVVAAVHGGLLTLNEACQRYNLSIEEFLSWQRSISRYGLQGLRTTKLKEYRDTSSRVDEG